MNPYLCQVNYLLVENLSKSFGDKRLFEDISFGLQQGQKTALVARNGAGKSTLMRILTGREIADSGKVVFRKDIRVSCLDQEPLFDPQKTILESIFSGNDPRIRAIRNYEHALELQQNEPNDNHNRGLEEAIAEVEACKAWDTETRVREVLGRLNIHHLDQKMHSLSGGQRKRVALATVLIEEPDLVLLDEPTNHLDVEMIEWLEAYLKNSRLTILMVTHDRYFLDQVCTDILELDRNQVFRYKGDYGYYLEKKAAAIEVLNSEIEKAKNLYVRELEWMRRMPKARGTKAKSRIDDFYQTQEKASQRIHQEKVQLQVKSSRLGGKILELIKVSKSFGEREIIRPFTYTFRRGEKIGIAGRNGSGKSTFLKLIMGEVTPDTGKIQVGETVVFGYYSQDGMLNHDDKRVIEVVREIADVIPMADGRNLSASGLLQMFLFPPDVQYTPVSKLSGGEKRRLYLLTVLMRNPNFLILDEPTNDLDIQTLNILQEFLENFSGCVLIVTHDRFFMDSLAEHLFVFDGTGEIKDFNGNYSEFRKESNLQKNAPVEKTPIPAPAETNKKQKNKASFKEVHEFRQLEQEIPDLEKQLIALQAKLSQPGIDHVEIARIAEDIAQTTELLDVKSNRWLELAERID